MESRKFDGDKGKHFLPVARDVQDHINVTSELNPSTRMSQIEYSTALSVAGTQSHIYNYQEPLQPRASLSESSETSTLERVSANCYPFDSHSVSKSQGSTVLQRQLAALPVKLESLGGSIQLITTKSKSSGGHTSLIPVVVSGDEIYQLQGQGPQKNVLILASPQSAQPAHGTGSQNVTNLTGLFSTSKEGESEIQFSKIQTGYQNPQTVPSYCQHSGSVSSQVKLGSVLSVQKGTETQTVASPVYKSKLEKAMAQNLLMQSSAKCSGNKSTAISSVSKISLPVTPLTGKSNQIRSELLNEGSASIIQETVPQNKFNEVLNPVKPAVRVSKVAEYYKNLVAGKGIQQAEKQVYSQHPVEQFSKSQSIPQYSVVPDVTNFHSNPVVKEVFNTNEAISVTTAEVDVMANSEEYSTLPAVRDIAVHQEDVIVREKTYEDHGLGKSILMALWKLREENLFCDAVLYIGSTEIKLHKVVLIGASPEIYKRVVTKTVDTMMKLVLPGDMLCENVMTFLHYIYSGVIKLTQYNVQQIYRLSAIFGMTKLSKHCYDFCKVAKMGHVIIGSPYQEAAKQIQKETTSQEVLPASTVSDQRGIQTTVTTSAMLSSPKVSTKIKSPVKKEVRDFETISSDIDWMTNDPSQSNIPIRKRGRNRKAVHSILTKSAEAAKKTENEFVEYIHEMDNERISSNETVETSSQSRNIHPKKNDLNRSELNQSLEYEIPVEYAGDPKSVRSESESMGRPAMDANRSAELIEDIVNEITALPDPLVSGKLDERELLKLKEVDQKSEKCNLKKNAKIVASQTFNKPETRRFRARANTSVLEAASKMKAKSNDVTSISTPKGRKKKGMKKSPTVLNTSQTSSEIKRLLSSPTRTVPESTLIVEAKEIANVPKQKSLYQSEDESALVTSVGSKEVEKTNDVINDINVVKNTNEDGDFQDKTKLTEKEEGDEEMSQKYPSAPKKAKLRKSTLEQQELRDTVYMRPPPKKRTKEIREMMKNEEDDKLRAEDVEENLKISDEGKFDVKEVEKENATKKSKQRRKRPRVKNDIVLSKVFEIEKLAAIIDSEKIYRCAFCSVEFKFAKRAITHLIGTHDIDLDDTTEYISVEKKSEDGKDVLHECDICGFRPKESGTYYIHYHKYFRHQVPLPKGWQAYKCDMCNKEFFTKFQLREHKLIHFEDNPFVCELCGSGFRSRTCLNSHVFHKHNSVRKHKCPECPKTFKTATQMKVHKRVHTGEKPFLCPSEHCKYRSTTRGNMKLHLTSKHKLNPATVKTLMESLEASEAGAEPLIFEDYTNDTNKQIVSRESGGQHGAFDMFVQSNAVETEVEDTREQYVTGQIEVINQENVISTGYNGAVQESNQSMLNARDYSLVNQGTIQNQDLEMVIQQDSQMLENQNIPRHVEMLIQDAHRFMQHQDSAGQNQYVQDYQQSAENEIQDMRNRLPEQASLAHTYESSSGSATSRFGESSQGPGTHKILDPHSKEARMIIREVFEGHGSRSLLKSAILHGNPDSHRLELGARHLPDNSNISESSNLINEAEKLVIDLHDSGNHQIPLNQEDEVIQRLRSQIQQLRESGEQYRDTNPAPLFRNDHSVPEILLQNIPSQQQTMEPTHFQTYHHGSGSPPAYSSSSHALISEIEAQSSVTLAPATQDDTQGQINSLQSLQGQGYVPVASQASASQYGPDGALYQGYYQEHYDIENY